MRTILTYTIQLVVSTNYRMQTLSLATTMYGYNAQDWGICRFTIDGTYFEIKKCYRWHYWVCNISCINATTDLTVEQSQSMCYTQHQVTIDTHIASKTMYSPI